MYFVHNSNKECIIFDSLNDTRYFGVFILVYLYNEIGRVITLQDIIAGGI